MTRTYHIRRVQLIYLLLFSIGWFALVVGTAVHHRMSDHWNGHAIGSAILLVLFALLPAYLTARIPHTVTISDEGTCTFRRLVGSRIVRAQQIRSITYDEGDLTLRHDRGTVDMRGLDDMRGFLAQLLELNPALELPAGWREDLTHRG